MTRSLSKSYCLAGVRFGFAITRPEVASELVKVKDSYNCDVLSLAAAQAALGDQDYLAQTSAKIVRTRTRHGRGNWPIWGSRSRRAGRTSSAVSPFGTVRRSFVYEELKRRRILIRYMPPIPATATDYASPLAAHDAEIDRLLAELKAGL